jgi:hypothetical protein
MNLKQGFTLDVPAVTVPWIASEEQLQELMGGVLRHVTGGYWVGKVQVLGGLRCNLGFHFEGQPAGLVSLEFFRDAYPDQRASFEEFQRHFEGEFGPPTSKKRGTDGYPEFRWRVPGADIVHYVYDRFGLEEHMRIVRAAR